MHYFLDYIYCEFQFTVRLALKVWNPREILINCRFLSEKE